MGAPAGPLYAGRIYPGLRPFDAEDALLFFGRSRQTDELLRRLDDTRFLAVVGLSGSGKSSLVRAGLLPALRRGHLAGAGSQWRVAVIRPGADPVRALAQGLNETLGAREDRQQMLGCGQFGLLDASRPGRAADENLLLVVDQFEEIFRFQDTHRQRAPEAAEFVRWLISATREYEPMWRVYVVITLRSDFVGECARFNGLPEALNESQYLVPRMRRDEMRDAIKGPAALGGVQLSLELTEELLDKTSDDPDQLPLLQHLLMRMWEVRERTPEDSRIGREQYESVGGWDDALNTHADGVWSALGEQRDLAKRIFQRLTEKTQGREVRRPATVLELMDVTEGSLAEVRAVVESYREETCSFLTSPHRELTEHSVIDISHESLIRQWKRLREWIAEEADWAGWYRRVEDRKWLNGAHLVEPELDLALQARAQGRWNKAWAQRYAAFDVSYDDVIGFLEESSKARHEGLENYFGRMISSLIPDAEQKHLFNLHDGDTEGYQGHGAMRAELRHLASAGLVVRKPGKAIAEMERGTTFDLADYLELTDLGKFLITFAEQEGSTRLGSALRLSEQYLEPVDLKEAEARAARIRQMFEKSKTLPKLKEVEHYLHHPDAAHRVVGYLVHQVAVQREDVSAWAPELAECLSREQNEALHNQETRPLWQLLVCITQAWKTPELSEENRNRLRSELRRTQNFLNANPHLDSGGQCKWKIGMLLG